MYTWLLFTPQSGLEVLPNCRLEYLEGSFLSVCCWIRDRYTSTNDTLTLIIGISKLLFDQSHSDLGVEKLLMAVSTLLVHLHVWAVIIQFTTLLQTKQTPLCAKLYCTFLISVASVMLNARSACRPLSRWGGDDLAEARFPESAWFELELGILSSNTLSGIIELQPSRGRAVCCPSFVCF